MRLLLLSFYYPPDLCAGSFRCAALVKALREVAPELAIDVLTTQPNRYRESSAQALPLEVEGNIRIFRFSLPSHDSGMGDQSRAFSAYARRVWKTVSENGDYDAVFATSSRLMTASLGAAVARYLKAPLYLDIRDLFADTIKDVLPDKVARPAGPLIRTLERVTFRSARRINVVSEGFSEHLRQVSPNAELRCFTNGIDDEFLTLPAPLRRRSPDEPVLIVYAGNVGEGQGLHRIVPGVARQMGERVRFRIIGHGGRIGQLRDALGADATNVELLPPVPRSELHRHYADADILFLHLNDYPAFRKVLPSKVFEYAATGRPIVAGVAGHSAGFVRDHVPGAEVFSPCDVDGMVRAVTAVANVSQSIDRQAFLEQYARSRIMTVMAQDIVEFIRTNY